MTKQERGIKSRVAMEYVQRLAPKTKQEEIREGLKGLPVVGTNVAVDQILYYLHSQGVVIKVDKELPQNPYSVATSWPTGIYVTKAEAYKEAQQDILKAGFGVATEPLIKDN